MVNDHGTPLRTGNLLFCGGGSSDPHIFAISLDAPGRKPIPIGDFQDRGRGLSIYALALSPRHRFLAAGTRPLTNPRGAIVFPSMVRIYTYPTDLEKGLENPVFEVFQPAGLCDLDITDEGLLAVASGDGVLRIYSTAGSQKAISLISGHQGHVFAVSWLGNSRLVSYGADGYAKIWDFATGTCLFTSTQKKAPTNGALMSLALDHDRRRIYHGSGDGQLSVLTFDGGEALQVPAHTGDFIAVSYHPVADRLITGGLRDGTLRVWSGSDLKSVGEHPLGVPIFAVIPLGESGFASVDATGRILLWDLNHAISLKTQLAQVDGRSWAGPNVQLLAQEIKAASSHERINCKRNAMAHMNNCDFASALEEIRSLASQGYSDDALVLQAAWYRKQGLLLLEYAVWQELKSHHGDQFPGSASAYLFADLCDLLLEPAIAAAEFEKIGEYRDSRERAQRSRSHPLLTADPATLVRADFVKPEQVLEEIEKCTLLRRHFVATLSIKSKRPVEITSRIDSRNLAKEIENGCPKDQIGQWAIRHEPVAFYAAGRLRNTEWVRVALKGEPTRRPALPQFALEIFSSAVGTFRIPYALFSTGNPPEGQDYVSWNRDVASRWADVYWNPEGKGWLNQVHRVFDAITDRLIRSEEKTYDSGWI